MSHDPGLVLDLLACSTEEGYAKVTRGQKTGHLMKGASFMVFYQQDIVKPNKTRISNLVYTNVWPETTPTWLKIKSAAAASSAADGTSQKQS